MYTTQIMIESLEAIRKECDKLWHMIDNEEIRKDICTLDINAFMIIRKLKGVE